MSHHDSERPLGEPVSFAGAQPPQPITLRGRYAAVRPLRAQGDAAPLYEVSHAPHGDPGIWTYLPYGPFPDQAAYAGLLEQQTNGSDPMFFVVTGPRDDTPVGQISYLSIVPEHGRIELGHIWFSPSLKRTPAATEAIYLLAKHAFEDLGYRRLEWKCNALNASSYNAALRFGFEFEGVFRNHMVVKGRNRDSAYFAITGSRWPAVSEAFERWLAPENFDEQGAQLTALRELTAGRPGARA
jgi:RimJ/RimL family protein N-acetyltransferase